MKYARLDLGQIEALVNKLGGMGAVEALLEGSSELTQKEERAWLRTLDKALAVRDILQAKGEYRHDDGVSTFRLMVSQAIDQVRNITERAIAENSAIDQEVVQRVIEKIDFALGELLKFEVRSGTGLEDVQFQLKKIKGVLQKGDRLSILKLVYWLRGYLSGAETLISLLLVEFDKANEQGGYQRRRSGK